MASYLISPIRLCASALLCVALLLLSSPALALYAQEGAKLVGTGATGNAGQGTGVAVSSDGNTVIVGGDTDSNGTGAAWVFTRSGGTWTQQGTKLVGINFIGSPQEGLSVGMSADGDTAIVGGYNDNFGVGAAWIFVRSNGSWSQQGNKLVGAVPIGSPQQGTSVALSGDGNTAIVGAPFDNSGIGAAWIYVRSGGAWSEQAKLIANDGVGSPTIRQGTSVALSNDGSTAIVGGDADNGVGAAWVFTRSGTTWTQQGSKLVGTGAVDPSLQGVSVAISGDGNTAAVGGYADDSNTGAVWIFTRNGGVWTQQGSKLVGTGAAGAAVQGASVALSGDGNTVVSGGFTDDFAHGAVWVFIRSGGAWSQVGSKLVGTGTNGGAHQGQSVALSADATTIISGGPTDISGMGAAWIFVQAGNLQISPTTGIASAGLHFGPFAPPAFPYQLSASSGAVAYSISGTPSWLDVTSTSGTVTTTPTTVTFSVNSSANSLALGTYTGTITFTDTTNGVTILTIPAMLVVAPSSQVLVVAPLSDMSFSGNQGGPFSPSFKYQLLSSGNSVDYAIFGQPAWLDVSQPFGTVSTLFGPVTVTFTVNSNANSLSVGTYNGTVTFENQSIAQANQTRNVALSVSTDKTYVSARTGTDTGKCPITAPCATLNYALSVTDAGGMVTIIGDGVFDPVVLTQAVSIEGSSGAGVQIQADPSVQVGCIGALPSSCGLANHGYAVEIAAGVNDTIALTNLLIGAGTNGAGALKFTSGGKIQLSNNVYRGNDTEAGPIVALYPNNPGTSQAQVYFSNSDIGFNNNNSNAGAVEVKPNGNTSLKLHFNHLEVHNASYGIRTDSSLLASSAVNVATAISESEMFSFANAAVNAFSTAGTGTTTAAFDAVRVLNANVAIKANGPQSTVILTNSTVSGNGTGVQVLNGAHVYTPQNNTILGNGADLSGSLSSAPPR